MTDCANTGDQILIKACEEYSTAQTAIHRLFYGASAIEDDDKREEAMVPFDELQEGLLSIVADNRLRANSLAGIKARARAASLYADGDEELEGHAAVIAACLLNDLISFEAATAG
jgi:hypothetical protein